MEIDSRNIDKCCKKALSSLTQNEEVKCNIEQLALLGNFIFEQNKMQQESKDLWFGHYLSILAGVSALSTIIFSVFKEIDMRILYIIAGSAFFFTGVMGFVFFKIFLCQRANCWKNYQLMNDIQIKLIEQVLNKQHSFYYSTMDPFAKRKHGADFYAVIVEVLMISICFGISIVFTMLVLKANIISIIICSCVVFGVVALILFKIFLKYEKNNKNIK